eukprot:TRINITY_DN1906_c0_g1_i1.p2 TRINITY_DN1906_c0_g1~~TRINITY_DN1906_c0_g1_i1.p2  ORF type:complete len:100 (-),score=26.88 TRINITY_DN1906_c0_g1_i1:379-678(-)
MTIEDSSSSSSPSPSSSSGNNGSMPKHPMADPNTCKELKDKHDQCFYKWYSERFLKGTVTLQCQEEWEDYQFCLKEKLKAWNLEYLQGTNCVSALSLKR